MVPSENVDQRNQLTGVAAISPNDIWAVGWSGMGSIPSIAPQPLIQHWDGSQWGVIRPNITEPAALNKVASLAANNAWAVGFTGTFDNAIPWAALVLNWDGTEWNAMPLPASVGANTYLADVAISSADNVWAVGTANNRVLILHWDGTQWNVVATPDIAASQAAGLGSITVVSANDVWAVGGYTSGNVLRMLTMHWDGSVWSIIPAPELNSQFIELSDVAAVSHNEIWAVGNHGTIGSLRTLVLRWNGREWSQVPSPNFGDLTNALFAVDAASDNNIWAVGISRENNNNFNRTYARTILMAGFLS